MEAQDAFDDGEWMFRGKWRNDAIVQHQNGDRFTAVDLVAELCLWEVAVELAVLRKLRQDSRDVVGGDDGAGGKKRDDEEDDA